MVKTNEVKRSYYLNLFSGNAEITDNLNDVPGEIVTGYSSLVGGLGYTEAPVLTIAGTCDGFTGSTRLTATTIDPNNYTILNRGSNYLTGDQLVFNNVGTGGSNLSISAIATNGLIAGYTSFAGGSGYVNAPSITATGGGTGFAATTFLTPTTVSGTLQLHQVVLDIIQVIYLILIILELVVVMFQLLLLRMLLV